MLPTFVIGLREGLEAALIVSIIATFLRKNGASVRGLWIGTAVGIVLSIAVGVVLHVVEASLPQRAQEGMESIIGLVAVAFVTGMVVWMRRHARHLKSELEGAAATALKNGTTTALAVMAFLAVLREGFETSVFLLATIQNASSAPAAMWGALIGIVCAAALGYGIYRGGVKLNLHTFFTCTSAFLILVAAGLTLMAFRTAHEAGWVTIGQGHTVDLSWLAPNGSIRSALLTGVLGIPNDPRMIEVVAWFAFLIPVLVLAYAPLAWLMQRRVHIFGAAVAAVIAIVMLIAVHVPSTEIHQPALPTTVSATELVSLNGGRLPVGINPSIAPGPYTAMWAPGTSEGTKVLTLTDGGLTSPRSVTVAVATAVTPPGVIVQHGDREVLKYGVPALLLIAALTLVLVEVRRAVQSQDHRDGRGGGLGSGTRRVREPERISH